MEKLVYIESSVIGFLTAKQSRDSIIAAYQKITREWWDLELEKHDCFIYALIFPVPLLFLMPAYYA
jgi:hypothetical protein